MPVPAEGGGKYSLLKPGQVIDRKYHVEHELGAGGMGAVFAAEHLTLKGRVAIKVLSPEMARNKEACERFKREARLMFKIKSEHIARVLDLGALEDSAIPYMVMEYLEGQDLETMLEKQGPLTVEHAVDYVLQACEVLAEAHGLAIIHRDLKPANLMLTQGSGKEPCVKVIDFGIAKDARQGVPDTGMTKTAHEMGTPHYMAPEQLDVPGKIDARTDVWALGVTLYRLLTNECPFDGHTNAQIYKRISGTPAPSARRFRPQLSKALDAVILQCLEKSRSKRWQSVAELATALMPFGSRSAEISTERVSLITSSSGSYTAPPSVAPPPDEREDDAPSSQRQVLPKESGGSPVERSPERRAPIEVEPAAPRPEGPLDEAFEEPVESPERPRRLVRAAALSVLLGGAFIILLLALTGLTRVGNPKDETPAPTPTGDGGRPVAPNDTPVPAPAPDAGGVREALDAGGAKEALDDGGSDAGRQPTGARELQAHGPPLVEQASKFNDLCRKSSYGRPLGYRCAPPGADCSIKINAIDCQCQNPPDCTIACCPRRLADDADIIYE